MRSAFPAFAVLVASVAYIAGAMAPAVFGRPITRGRLDVLGPYGVSSQSCPLKHTDVTVDVSGYVARVTVRQQFHNPFQGKIEAMYVFPLSQNAAVDRMTMKVGERLIEGEIKGRNAARKIYESAKAAGKVAGLLDQQRPNIFRQSVANIEPGERIDITISYSETLDWLDGDYHFDFPMVVGPRYMPGAPADEAAVGWSPPTDQVPNADLISPKIPPEGSRAGHDISITVHLNAGLPIRRIESKQHAVTVEYPAGDKSRAVVTLKKNSIIPNKDFVLVYQTASNEIGNLLLAHSDKRGKFFTLVIQPPKRVTVDKIVPKEIIFVIDKSGSMCGFPIETAKKAMRMCIEGLYPRDTFNMITFAGGVGRCFPQPVPNTDENRRVALQYLDDLEGSGGTEMMDAIHACLTDQNDPRRVRIVCFMTDGYVGNDMAIIDAAKQHAGAARVFVFGIGKSVNRYLLDEMARAGRGEVQYVLSKGEAIGAAERFHERVRTPVLTDIQIDFGNLPVEDVYPDQLPDLFSTKPLVIKGRYAKSAGGTITLRGKTGQGKFKRKIEAELPGKESRNEVLAPLWARAKVNHLMRQNLPGIQRGQPDPAIQEEILGLGLRYQLLTQFTSFVAVEHKRTTEDGPLTVVGVPVEMPAKVSREGIFDIDSSPMTVPLSRFGAETAPMNDLLREIGPQTGSGLHGRGTAASRSAAVRRFGGSSASEAAVAAGLRWLAEHQAPDGSWGFDHGDDGQSGGFANPGTRPSRIHATALALLPMLGAGQTHVEGKYKSVVDKGLKFLIREMKVGPDGGDLRGKDGSMLAHALATLTLCEAYGMTHDKKLIRQAQSAVDFITSSQHRQTGGWAPKAGDTPTTLVTAWHVLALKSAYMDYLRISPETVRKATAFFDRVQADDGTRYGQTDADDAKPDDQGTAAGLLCRMYLGWKKDNPTLSRGVVYLSGQGPSKTDAMYNFYATQVRHHIRGENWRQWNAAMRDALVKSQEAQGDEAGSWFNPADVGATEGGRLEQTASNIMILEIYYRHLPIYSDRSVKEAFPD